MKKVYFYLEYVTLLTDNTHDYIVDDRFLSNGDYGVIQSEFFNSIEEAFEDKESHAFTSPVMEGWIKE